MIVNCFEGCWSHRLKDVDKVSNSMGDNNSLKFDLSHTQLAV